MQIISIIATLAVTLGTASALSSTLQQVTGFRSSPTNAQMYVYIPSNKVANPLVVVAVHACHGSATAYFQGTQAYAEAADKYGFIIIYPSTPSTDGCWDVASAQSLTRNGGGDSQTIINMVNYAISNYGADKNRVYVTGTSSGAMMTNVLVGAYPDIFKAATLYGGVPDGCFYTQGAQPGTSQPAWNTQCAQGQVVKSAQQWGDQARGYYPGYSGSRPKMLIFHGTLDNVLYYQNFVEELKQWSNVLGVSFSRNETNTPISGYTKMIYGDGSRLVGVSAYNVGHTPPVRPTDDLAWFGIPGSGTTPSTTRAGPTTASPKPTTANNGGSGGTVPQWGQCGGQGWTGGTQCVSPYKCTFSNTWYSQCL